MTDDMRIVQIKIKDLQYGIHSKTTYIFHKKYVYMHKLAVYSSQNIIRVMSYILFMKHEHVLSLISISY